MVTYFASYFTDCTPACLFTFIIYYKPKYGRKLMALLEQGIWQQEFHIVVKILLASCGVGMKSHCTVTTKRLLSTATSCECNPNTVLVNGQTYSESAMPTDSNLASKLHGHYCTYTFSSPHPPRSALKTTYSTVKCVHGISSGLKRPGRGVNHHPI